MSPDDMADYHKHMEAFCRKEHEGGTGIVAASWMAAVLRHAESARYWREKAKENA